MKMTCSCLALLACTLILVPAAPAQHQIAVGAGVDLMLPVGSFADNWGMGIGGTAELDYLLSSHTSLTGKLGYLTWSGKDLPSGISATYGGVPFLVGVKYYPHLFVSQSGGPGIRAYGHLELGLMFGSVSLTGTSRGYTGSISGSTTDFTIVPSLGVEIPAGSKGAVDLSVRYFDISKKSSIGFRAGYKMVL